MIQFNADTLLDVRVENDNGSVEVHIGDDTLRFNPNEEDSGYSITPDWNDRHFTLAIKQDSVLYHITRDGDEERSGEGNRQPEDLIVDVYLAFRALGPALPAERLPLSIVGNPDREAIEKYLQEKMLSRRTDTE